MVRSLESKVIPHPNGQKMGLKEGLPKVVQRSREGKSPSFTPQVSGFRMARKV